MKFTVLSFFLFFVFNSYTLNTKNVQFSNDSFLVAERGSLRSPPINEPDYYVKSTNDTIFYPSDDDTLYCNYSEKRVIIFTREYLDGYMFVDSINNLKIVLRRTDIFIVNSATNEIVLDIYKDCFYNFYNFMKCGYFDPKYNYISKQLTYYEQNRMSKKRVKRVINL